MQIELREINRATEKMVFFENPYGANLAETRELKNSPITRWCETFEEAKLFLVNESTAKANQAKRRYVSLLRKAEEAARLTSDDIK